MLEFGSIATIKFAVLDTGPGIHSSKLSQIFEPFTQLDGSVTRRHGGSGLGLSISARLVTALGGQLDVKSQPSQGSTFSFSIPLSVAESSAGRDAVRPDLPCRSVLVVDDEPWSRNCTVQALRNLELQTLAADSEAQALELLDVPPETRNIDLLILDATLPDSRSFAIVEHLTKLNRLPPTVIMLASKERHQETRRWRQCGIEVTVVKPVKPSSLLDAMVAALHGAQKAVSGTSRTSRTMRLPSLRLLIAEDNVINQQLMRRLFEKKGHETVVVDNGIAAVARLTSEHFDVGLLDVMMPGCDGLTAARRIREHERVAGGHIPLIAVTAHAVLGDKEQCLSAGYDAYLSKPIGITELFETVSSLLRNSLTDVESPSSAPAPSVPFSTCEMWFDSKQAVRNAGGDRELSRELVEVFLKEYPVWLAEMHTALSNGDSELLHRIAHTIKGATMQCGIVGAHDLSLTLERFGEDGRLSDARVIVDELWATLQRAEPLLRAFVAADFTVPLGEP